MTEQGLPIFDELSLLSQLGGDRDLAIAIVLSALEDIPDYFDKLEQAVVAGQWQAAELCTHTMKGLLAQIGGLRFAERMKELNNRLKAGADIDNNVMADLRVEYGQLTDILQEWLR